MFLRKFAPVLVLFCAACTSFPNNDPGEEIFTKDDYKVWQEGKQEIPKELLGVWRVVEQAGTKGELAEWYYFQDEGIFATGLEAYFRTAQGKPVWEGAYRMGPEGQTVIVHYQRKNGDDGWIETQGGKGKVKNFKFSFNDSDTLVLHNQTSQNLIIKYKRVAIKANED